MLMLGTIVDLVAFEFRVSRSRAAKIRGAILTLQAAVRSDWYAVPAKSIASLLGLIYSISVCCHRAASVMCRALIAVLTNEMRRALDVDNMRLSSILAMFWSGTVCWSIDAQRCLAFWADVDFGRLRSPISADVLGKSIESVFDNPAIAQHANISILCQDASATAAGGGIVRLRHGLLSLDPQLFLAMFSHELCEASSTLRELVGILMCLWSTERKTRQRIVFACDNYQSVQAILLGSRIPVIQFVADLIFRWCLTSNKVCWPI